MTDYEELSKALCDAHWSYIKALLDSHDIGDNEKRTAEFHYKSAFIHGYGHGVEDACNGKVKWERDDNESN